MISYLSSIYDTSESDYDSELLSFTSDFEMIGGDYIDEIYSSSDVDLETEFSMFKNDTMENEMKELVLTTFRTLATLIKIIKDRNYYKDFDAEKKFLEQYNNKINIYLNNKEVSDINDRKTLKNLIRFNLISLMEVKKLIEKNEPKVLQINKISNLISKINNIKLN